MTETCHWTCTPQELHRVLKIFYLGYHMYILRYCTQSIAFKKDIKLN